MFAALNLVIAQPYNEDTQEYIIKTSYANDFLGQYVGQTSPKTYTHLLQNLDTVIFVDEAYAITDGSQSKDGASYGEEAMNTVVPFLSSFTGLLSFCVAGYTLQMERFLSTNEGLSRRIPS